MLHEMTYKAILGAPKISSVNSLETDFFIFFIFFLTLKLFHNNLVKIFISVFSFALCLNPNGSSLKTAFFASAFSIY